MMVYQALQGQAPILKVFGWVDHKSQGVIHMAFIEDETLQEKQGSMGKDKK